MAFSTRKCVGVGGGISEPREAQRGPERPSLDRTSLLCAWLAGWLAGGVAGWLRPREVHATHAHVFSSYASPLICNVAGFLNFGLLFHSCEHRSAHSCQLPRLPACFPAATKFATPCRTHPRGTKPRTPVSTFAPDVVPMIRPGPPGDCIITGWCNTNGRTAWRPASMTCALCT